MGFVRGTSMNSSPCQLRRSSSLGCRDAADAFAVNEDRMASTSTRAAVWPLIVIVAVPDCPGLTGSLAPSGLMSHRR